MARRTLVTLGCAVVALTCLAAGTASAQQPIDKRTFFTFSGPVAVPGVTLPHGKYLFRVVNTESHQDVIQVLTANGKKPLAMFYALPAQRAKASDIPEIGFKETPEGTPAAVGTWWHPGLTRGHEFVYPKNQARLLAKTTGQPVLTTVAETTAPIERPAELARIEPSGKETEVQESEPAQVAAIGPELPGELAPPSIAIPEFQEARAALPRTASTLPVVALAGLLLVAGGLLVRHAVRA